MQETAAPQENILNEQVNRVAAGGDDDIFRVAVNHMLIFCLDYCCADSGLLGVEKAELLSASRIAFMPTPS